MNTRNGVSAWCIDHPIATLLLTFALVLLGPSPSRACRWRHCRKRFPTIQVTAQLPGASPETMASSVATPLEVQFSAIPGMTQMTSSSALGSTNLTLQFTLDKNIDTAAQEVQAAINTATARLPKDMPSPPTWRKVNPADSPVLILTSVPPDARQRAQRLRRNPAGAPDQPDRRVGQINITGQRPAIRVQAQPEKLAAIGLTLADIRLAIQQTSLNLAKGALYGEHSVSTMSPTTSCSTPRTMPTDRATGRRPGAPARRRQGRQRFGKRLRQAWSGDQPGSTW
jgi:HAE1 family hydrophobic/amphiphilic exporter-1